jgi:hypothetical protein
VHAGYAELASRGTLDEDHPWRLAHEIDYAVARRDSGLPSVELRVLADKVHDVRRQCWRRLGADHPQTLAAAVVQASIAARVAGREGEAERLLEDTGRRYASALPGHPYAAACTGFLAAVRSASGGQEQVARQVPVLGDVAGRLAGAVGEGHPLALTAAAALANALARSGELDAALGQGKKALSGLQQLLGREHPHSRACEANLAVIASGQGIGQLTDIDFTPLPL